jgi:hypothetical protein
MVVPLGCGRDWPVLAAVVDYAEAEAEELPDVVIVGLVCAAMEPLEVALVDSAQALATPPVEVNVKFLSYTRSEFGSPAILGPRSNQHFEGN